MEKLYNSILEGIFRKKGEDIIKIDLRKIGNAFCDYFIICHGGSNTQVKSIADSIEEKVKENLNEKAHHKEGVENSIWILLDYNDIVVHIFQKEYRGFYNLEGLWADAEMSEVRDIKDYNFQNVRNG
ncbi:ribosome silencing factor [Bacteroidota bacterium]